MSDFDLTIIAAVVMLFLLLVAIRPAFDATWRPRRKRRHR